MSPDIPKGRLRTFLNKLFRALTVALGVILVALGIQILTPLLKGKSMKPSRAIEGLDAIIQGLEFALDGLQSGILIPLL